MSAERYYYKKKESIVCAGVLFLGGNLHNAAPSVLSPPPLTNTNKNPGWIQDEVSSGRKKRVAKARVTSAVLRGSLQKKKIKLVKKTNVFPTNIASSNLVMGCSLKGFFFTILTPALVFLTPC